MYDKWAEEHDRVVTMRRVALPLLIEAIRTTDYGDFQSRNDLISRLRESIRSYESTAIPLGHRGSFEFAANPAANIPIELGHDILPPLPLRVKQALFPAHRPRSLVYFRLTARAIPELRCQPPEGSRQHEYGCWCGIFPSVVTTVPLEAERTGRQDDVTHDSVYPREPLYGSLAVVKHRTSASGSNSDVGTAEGVATRDVSGSSIASGNSSLSGQRSLLSHATRSSVGSLPSSMSSVDTARATDHCLPGESKMLAALSGITLKLEDAVFLYIGALFARQSGVDTTSDCSSEKDPCPVATVGLNAAQMPLQWTETDYIVAVNLCDLSVYLVYLAWHENTYLWQTTDNMDPINYERFKPQNSDDWARLPGHENSVWPGTNRCVLAKISDNVHEWALGDYSTLFTVSPVLMSRDYVPLLESVEPGV